MKKIVFLLFALGVFCAHAQVNSGNDILNKAVTKDKVSKFSTSLITKLSVSGKEYDEASFSYAISLSDNADMYENEERYKKQEKLLAEILRLGADSKNYPLEDAVYLNTGGEMLFASNKYRAAESLFKASAKIFEEKKDFTNEVYAHVLSNLGLLYNVTGRYVLSEKFSDSARHLRAEIFPAGSSQYAASMNNLGVLYKDMGNYNKAQEYIAEAIRINAKALTKKSVPYALAINNQAMLLQALGRYDEAEPLLQEALKIAGETLKEKSINYGRLMTNLAFLYQEMGRLEDAEVIYLKLSKIKEKKLGTQHPDYAHLLNLLAALYVRMNNEKQNQVVELLIKSTAIYKKKLGEKHPLYAKGIADLGNFYRIKGNVKEAEPLLQNALNIRKESLGIHHPDYASAVESLGLLYWQTKKIHEAATLLKQAADENLEYINNYFTSMSEPEKSRYWDKIRPSFQRFYSFALSNYMDRPTLANAVYNYQLATKALLLNATAKVREQILAGKDKTFIQNYNDWLDQKENLERLHTLSKEQLVTERVNLDSLEGLANDREKELSAKSKLFTMGYVSKSLTYKQVVENLGPEEAAIEIIQFRKFDGALTDTVEYAALILTQKTVWEPIVVVLPNGNELEKKYYNYYKNCIRKKLKDEVSYGRYWGEIDNALKSIKTVYLSSDGIFNQINVNTLLMPAGEYVIDRKNLVLVPNTREVLQLKSKVKSVSDNKDNTAVLIGYPEYGSKGIVVRLPGTKTEVENIRTILSEHSYKTDMYMQSEASEERVKSLKNPEVLHIATHGYFLPERSTASEDIFGIASDYSLKNPLLRSGLLLAGAEKALSGDAENGLLTSFEIMNLDLDHSRIVVLSACEAGLGDVNNGESVYGLQRAFQVAGAQTIVMSLWKVNDAATQELMLNFYNAYLNTEDRHKSFTNAVQALKTKFPDPYYWGAFVMIE